MTLLTRAQIEDALRRLGELAQQHGESIELLAVGGAVYAFLDLWENLYDND